MYFIARASEHPFHKTLGCSLRTVHPELFRCRWLQLSCSHMVFGSRGALLSLIASVVANADPAQSFALDPLALYFAGNRLFGFALLDSADSLCVRNPSPHGWLVCGSGTWEIGRAHV